MAKVFSLVLAAAASGDPEPAVAGVLTATVWVSLAMLALIGILIWKKVPAMIAGILDGKIAQIKTQLDEAEALRSEAEALRDEYQAKLAALDAEAIAIQERTRVEADALLAKAQIDVSALIARRQRMAEDRILASERAAIAEVRAIASRAAVAAAGALIADDHDANSDMSLVDRAIADVAHI